jgi:hypothetical protein
MSSAPRDPAWHYQQAERLAAAAESSITEGIQSTAALAGIVHALLAQAPRKAPAAREAQQRRQRAASEHHMGRVMPCGE